MRRGTAYFFAGFCLCFGVLNPSHTSAQETPANGNERYPNVVAMESGVLLPMGRLNELQRVSFAGGLDYARRGFFLDRLVLGASFGYDYFWGEAANVEQLQVLSLLARTGYLLPIAPRVALEPRLSYGYGYGYGYNVLSFAESQEAVDNNEFSTGSAFQPELRAAITLSITVAEQWEIQAGPEYRIIFEPNEVFPSLSLTAGAHFLLPDRSRPGPIPAPSVVEPRSSVSTPTRPVLTDTLDAIVAEDTTVERTEQEITINIRVLFEPFRAELVGEAPEQLDRVAAVRSDGTLWTFGRNWYGELGDGTTTDRSTPVQIVVR